MIAVGSMDKTIEIWKFSIDDKSFVKLTSFKGHQSSIDNLVLKSSQVLASSSKGEEKIMLWDIK